MIEPADRPVLMLSINSISGGFTSTFSKPAHTQTHMHTVTHRSHLSQSVIGKEAPFSNVCIALWGAEALEVYV